MATPDSERRLVAFRGSEWREYVLDRICEALPDVIVLDLDKRSTGDLVHAIVHRFPRVKVVACSSQHPTMRVFPPLHYGEFYESDLDPALLTSAVQA